MQGGKAEASEGQEEDQSVHCGAQQEGQEIQSGTPAGVIDEFFPAKEHQNMLKRTTAMEGRAASGKKRLEKQQV